MTNRERAQKIIDNCFPASASSRLADIGLDLIEEALDKAEKRGQENMRKRAAKAIEGSIVDMQGTASQIRVLPIEVEPCEK